MLIAVVNKSNEVSDEDGAAMTRACATQLRYHTAPAWEKNPAAVIFYESEGSIPPSAHTIGILDDADQQGDLGWHTEANPGVIFGRVFARPVLQAGGDALHKELSVASVLSHEVQEMFCDPNINLWADDFEGRAYALEVCDPVESQSYAIDGITVSNFVFPAWFDAQAAKESQFDFLRKTASAFELAPQSYVIYEREGKSHQEFSERYPEWRKGVKSVNLARTAHRLKRAATRGER